METLEKLSWKLGRDMFGGGWVASILLLLTTTFLMFPRQFKESLA